MKIPLHLYTAPLRSQYGVDSIHDVAKVPEERARYLLEAGIARRAKVQAETATVPEPEAETAEEAGPDLDDLTKPELVEMAEDRGVEVVRQDGEDLPPKKSDYIAALSG